MEKQISGLKVALIENASRPFPLVDKLTQSQCNFTILRNPKTYDEIIDFINIQNSDLVVANCSVSSKYDSFKNTDITNLGISYLIKTSYTRRIIRPMVFITVTAHNDITLGDLHAAKTDELISLDMSALSLSLRFSALVKVLNIQKRHLNKKHSAHSRRTKLMKGIREVRKDLQQAAVIQKGILPTKKRFDDLRIGWMFHPSSMLGGDTFDYAKIDDSRLFFYSLDVSGHGSAAALLSMYLHNYFANEIRRFRITLAEQYQTNLAGRIKYAMDVINQQMLEKMHFVDNYFTAFVGIIDTDSEELLFVQAGHPRPFLVNRKGNVTTTISNSDVDAGNTEHQQSVLETDWTGLPAAMMPNHQYKVFTVPFLRGSRLVVYSDGIYELNYKSKGKLFDNKDFQNFLERTKTLSAIEMTKTLEQELKIGTNVLPDDVSFFVIDFNDYTPE
jgi:sigma-B regulation protein RsbU (phosphoserine phosphatase)